MRQSCGAERHCGWGEVMGPAQSRPMGSVEKVRLVLSEADGERLEVLLHKSVLRAIRHGVSSAPVDADLVNIALAHAAKKFLQDAPGDDFVRTVWGAEGRVTDCLGGPVAKLCEEASRALWVQSEETVVECSCGGTPFHRTDTPWQPPCWSDGSFSERTRPVHLVAVYDDRNIAFVTERGATLLVARHQLAPTLL